jgi:hypothetical protein
VAEQIQKGLERMADTTPVSFNGKDATVESDLKLLPRNSGADLMAATLHSDVSPRAGRCRN